MELFVGLDVSVRTTSVCVMDASGKLIRECKVETEPEAISELLHTISGPYKRVGLEAGPLSQWLYSGLASRGLSGDLRRDAAHEGRALGADQQDRSQ